MNKKSLYLMFLSLITISLSGCVGKTEIIDKPSSFITSESEESVSESVDAVESGNSSSASTEEDENPTYTVNLLYNNKAFVGYDNELYAVFYNNYKEVSVLVDSTTGIASTDELDGTFSVCLSETPTRRGIEYTYNPNGYTVDYNHPTVDIEIIKVSKVNNESRANGKDLYENIYTFDTTGIYRVKLTSEEKRYFQFSPKESGTYSIESLVNTHDDEINPTCYRYEGSASWKNVDHPEIYISGGASNKNGFTKNFRFEVNFDKTNVGGIVAFGLTADLKTTSFPIEYDFRIRNETEFAYDQYDVVRMYPSQIKEVTPNYSSSLYEYVDTRESNMLVGSHYKLNEEDGYYHVYNPLTETYGPILCASITKNLLYIEEAFMFIEDHGNKNLVLYVDGKMLDYQGFITGEKYYDSKNPYGGSAYCDYVNSDGVCYVTPELKEFLQRYSVSQRLFNDGQGYFELEGVYATEEDQWLFACGYYQNK